MAAVDEIKARLDVVDLINETVDLKDCGGDEWKGALNPGSQSGKSLNVNRAMQLWHDWPSDMGGTALDWIAHINNLNINTEFRQVLTIAAEKAGIPLDTNSSYNNTPEILTVLRAAAQWNHNQLTPEHRSHITDKWGISDDTIDKYLIGYAPGGKDATALQAALCEVFPVELVRSSGLLVASNNGWVAQYQDRIVFPYLMGGNVVYSIARSMEENTEDKYLKHLTNTTQKTVDPSIKNVIFGQDSLKDADYCVITEGVTDCLMVLQAGIPCISPVTVRVQEDDHPRILELVKDLKTVYICNDNEVSGIGSEGAQDTADLLKSKGVDVRMIQLPKPEGVDKIDLADFLRDNPVDAFKELMDATTSTQDDTHTTAKQPEIIDMANMLLDKGDPFNFVLDTWNETHIGDKHIGQTALLSVGSTYIKNSKGIHVKPSGNSGTGKSDALNTMLHLLPPEKHITGSLSGKALFYDEDLKAGCIICNDDQNLNEDLIDTIKQSTSKYQDETLHRTVVKQKKGEYSIPARVTFWLAGVDGFDDSQMGNRFINTDVDESTDQDTAVYNKQVSEEYSIVNDDEVTDQVRVCREIFNLLGEELYNVKVPFVDSIKWFNKDNRRNFPMFKDMIRVIALFKQKQGRTYNRVILATVNDFLEAKEIYQELSENNATNLTNNELKVMEFLETIGEAEIKDIARAMGCSATTARKYMHGKDANTPGGILAKVPGVHYKQISTNEKAFKEEVNEWTSTTTKRNIYVCETDRFSGNSYKDVVFIDEEKANKEFMEAVTALTTHPPKTPLKPPQLSLKKLVKPLLVDLINNNIDNNDIMCKNNKRTKPFCSRDSIDVPVSSNTPKTETKPTDSEPPKDLGVFQGGLGVSEATDSEPIDKGEQEAQDKPEDTQSERLNKLKSAVERYERFNKCVLDKHNYKYCAAEFVRLNPDQVYDQVLTDLQQGWNISDNDTTSLSGAYGSVVSVEALQDIPEVIHPSGKKMPVCKGDVVQLNQGTARALTARNWVRVVA
ncbi:MAG: hypothetical protein K8R08_08130 [Methanosarcinales archaeon]|nr:hypothetical protein [Methanosarcinales archaeon]